MQFRFKRLQALKGTFGEFFPVWYFQQFGMIDGICESPSGCG
jgi:hypothetical protein